MPIANFFIDTSDKLQNANRYRKTSPFHGCMHYKLLTKIDSLKFVFDLLFEQPQKNKLCHNKIMSPSFSFPFISINVFFSSIFVSMFFSRCNHLHLVLHRSIIQRNESRRRSKYWSTNGLRRWNNKSTKSTSTIQCANHRQMNNNNLQTEL